MKKTLITLLAIGGISMGATLSTTNLVSQIKADLTEQNYEAGDSFAITFTLEGVWSGEDKASILTLGNLYGGDTAEQLRVQTSTDNMAGAIIGVARDNFSMLFNSSTAYWTSGTRVWDSESATLTTTVTGDEQNSVWMQFANPDDNDGKALANNTSDLRSAAITLSYDYTTNTSSVKIVNASNVTSIVNFENTLWDATSLAGGQWNNATWGDVVTVSVTPAVPEPATATLSLLALAGLAARRRRK